ncbi:MAG: FadR/GntR family transcriptional regulator [Burkholderiaceae bacterium]
MPPVRQSDTRRLYQQVADQIRAVIADGAYPVGSRLPPERELALQLGVSRPSLREALIALEIDGRVEIRMGSGVYVCAPARRADHTPALGESPSELMHARAALESAVIVLAAARVTRQGMERIRGILDAMRDDHARGRGPLENDRRFHVAIAEMGGNSVLVRLVGELFDERHGPIASRLSIRSENVATWSEALAEHERIYEALDARDPQAAAAAMGMHLRASQARWVGGTATDEPGK